MYEGFLNLRYRVRDDLICLFRIQPAKGYSIKRIAKIVAAESSVGTWTEVEKSQNKNVKKLRAKVFSIKGNEVKIAYPSRLFEKANVPNILSGIAGNIMGMKAVKNIRLEDVSFSRSILRAFKGPEFGISGLRKRMKIRDRPFLGTIIKPKLGLKPEQHAESAYLSWKGGCDFVKDDENLASQKFNTFEKRLTKTLEKMDEAKQETGEKKAYLVNITAETKQMLKRAERVKEQGGNYLMLDIITAGWAALQTLREANFKLPIHAHRAMHAAFTRNKKQGISMMVIADFARLIGVDTLHIGTGIGKLEGEIEDVEKIREEIEEKNVKAVKGRLEQKWRGIKPVLAVSSGGLHPGHVAYLIEHLGKDIVIQMGGGIHGHPGGTEAGAEAARQAIDAVMKKIPVRKHARMHIELKEALEMWGK